MMRTLSLFSVLACLATLGCSGGETPQAQTAAKTEGETPASSAAATTPAAPEAATEKIDVAATMQRVKQLFQEGNYREAFPLLDQLHLAKACPPEGYAIRAQILDHSGLLAQAIASLNLALTAQPTNADWQNMLGLLFVKGQNYPLAKQAFTKAVEIKPEFSKAYNNRGLMFIAMKEYGQAVNDFNSAIQIDPTYLDALNNRGYAYLEQGNYSKAVENFTKAVELDPKYIKGYNNRGFARLKVGDAEEAVADFTKAIELSPLAPKHYLHRRDAWLALGKQQEADKDQLQAQWVQQLQLATRKIQREPQVANHFVERAEHFALGGKFDDALTDLKQAEKLANADLAALKPTGDKQADEQKTDKFEKQLAKIYNVRATIYYGQKEYQAAIDSCSKALEFDQDFDARSLRGDAYLAVGKLDQAIDDYTAAQRFDAAVASAYWQRAESRKQSGDTAGADSDRKTALQLKPELDQTATATK